MNILMLTIGFFPNVGGIETHFSDFINYTQKRKIPVTVLTYQPLETPLKGKNVEKSSFVTIVRIPILRGLFYKLVHRPFLEFIYLFPGLFLVTPFFAIRKKITVIHAHGIIAGCVGAFWSTLFNKKLVVSTHSVYHFPTRGMYRYLAKWVFQKASKVLVLSKQSKEELEGLGIKGEKVKVFTYWVDQKLFKPLNKKSCRARLEIKGNFVVLFVGRLIPEKGINPLLKAAKEWNDSITLLIAGVGPMEEEIKKVCILHKNIIFLGNLSQEKLPLLYNSADVLIVPSIHEEGFGRVILEALSCGIPVIGADRGGIKEAMNGKVGKLISISPTNIDKSVFYFYKNKDLLKEKARNALIFARNNYNAKNAEIILKNL